MACSWLNLFQFDDDGHYSNSAVFLVDSVQLALADAHLLLVAHDDRVNGGLQASQTVNLFLLVDEVLFHGEAVPGLLTHVLFLSAGFGILASLVKVDGSSGNTHCQSTVPVS